MTYNNGSGLVLAPLFRRSIYRWMEATGASSSPPSAYLSLPVGIHACRLRLSVLVAAPGLSACRVTLTHDSTHSAEKVPLALLARSRSWFFVCTNVTTCHNKKQRVRTSLVHPVSRTCTCLCIGIP